MQKGFGASPWQGVVSRTTKNPQRLERFVGTRPKPQHLLRLFACVSDVLVQRLVALPVCSGDQHWLVEYQALRESIAAFLAFVTGGLETDPCRRFDPPGLLWLDPARKLFASQACHRSCPARSRAWRWRLVQQPQRQQLSSRTLVAGSPAVCAICVQARLVRPKDGEKSEITVSWLSCCGFLPGPCRLPQSYWQSEQQDERHAFLYKLRL